MSGRPARDVPIDREREDPAANDKLEVWLLAQPASAKINVMMAAVFMVWPRIEAELSGCSESFKSCLDFTRHDTEDRAPEMML